MRQFQAMTQPPQLYMILGGHSNRLKRTRPVEVRERSIARRDRPATVFGQTRSAFPSVERPLSRSFGESRLLAHLAPRTTCFPKRCNLASISGNFRSAKALTLRASVAKAGLHTLLNLSTLKLRHGTDYIEHQASRRSRKVKI